MNQDYTIRLETKNDYREAEQLTREAFWNVYRPGCLEHYVLHVLRDDPAFVPELDFVMERDGRLIGHVMYLRSEIHGDDGRVIPIMTFGPISIAPDCKGQGYGTRLLRCSMEAARKLGAGALAITGNIGFYGKSGFVVASTCGIHYFAQPREAEVPYFLIRELEPGFLDGVTGVYRDPEGYFVDEAAAEAFDALFPPREKRKLPGQLV
ncbi:N-acetyltransferase [Flavonifractor sp. DFI.6.63]|jgi:putative acetyltransferase|uniref:GNAT family N-acetyltransferase n=1 Tax=Flavonifractor sp. DFI.6.63 TaxID=2963704 RepID=UPI00210B9305|nr:N-acetyltransferase [Flavonifractor sp. DFI.6.63]MBS1385311.1 N-acetyltransferase [Flavonifractor sp.]MCQ5030827.1 N-acetyltransferase [Flavonifractor sp. DFI.6.63]MDU2196223.1 N-acetyltransferase [Clostridiales bacterium]